MIGGPLIMVIFFWERDQNDLTVADNTSPLA